MKACYNANTGLVSSALTPMMHQGLKQIYADMKSDENLNDDPTATAELP